VLGATYALTTGSFERLLVVPVFAHAFDKPLSPFAHRVTMARLAFTVVRGAEVSPVEERLGTPSRTLRTIDHLLTENPLWKLRLVIGSDVLPEAPKWLSFEEIVQKAPLFVLGRAGAPHPDAPPSSLPEVSSTDVRRLMHETAGPRVDHPELSRLVPRAVLAYADEHGLYR
jgi:nicotinate-nucleotide adenylyltransferase